MAQYKAISATTQIKTGASRLNSISVSSTSAGTMTVYNETAGGTTNVVLDTLTPSAGAHMFFGDEGLALDKGLYVVIANTLKVTLGFK